MIFSPALRRTVHRCGCQASETGSSYVLKPDVQNRIFFPVFVVKVPPLFRQDCESLAFHSAAQDRAMFFLLGCCTGVVGGCTLCHLVVTAGHLDFFAALE